LWSYVCTCCYRPPAWSASSNSASASWALECYCYIGFWPWWIGG
jgi:hypothetical protein